MSRLRTRLSRHAGIQSKARDSTGSHTVTQKNTQMKTPSRMPLAEVVASAKATVEQATDPTPAPAALPAPASGRSPVPALVALALSVLAILLVRRLRRDDE